MIDITTEFLFRLCALNLMFTLIGLATMLLIIWNEMKVMKEAIAVIVGVDPNIAKKVNELFKQRKSEL